MLERVEWRLSAGAVGVTLLPALGLGLSTGAIAESALGPESSLIRRVIFGLAAGTFAAGLLVLVGLCIGTRVRLISDGVEVRRFKTALYEYGDITDARIDRGNNDRTIRLTMRTGKTHTLPAPTRGLRPPSDTTLDQAVSSIRRRSGLTPSSPRAR
jgi:hypothetical protein